MHFTSNSNFEERSRKAKMTLHLRCSFFILLVAFGICQSETKDVNRKTKCPDLSTDESLENLQIEPFASHQMVLSRNAFRGVDFTLSLKLLSKTSKEKCWYKFDESTLLLTFLADYDVIRAQPSDGYLFELTAKSNCDGKELKQTFRAMVLQTRMVSCMDIQIEIEVNEKDRQSACAMTIVSDVLKRSQYYMSHETGGSLSLRCVLQEYEQLADNSIRLVVGMLASHSSHCRELCVDDFFQTYSERVVNEFGMINQLFEQLLSPVYTVHSAHSSIGCSSYTTLKPLTRGTTTTLSSKPDPQCFPPTTQSPIRNVVLSTANHPSEFSIPPNIFNAQHTLSLSLHMTTSLMKETSCWFLFSPPFIHFFPTDQTVAMQPQDGYQFRLTATNRCGRSTSVNFAVSLKDKTIVESCYYFEVTLSHSKNLCEETILREFYKKLQSETMVDLRVTTIRRETLQKSIIGFTLLEENQKGCSHCSVSFLEDLVRRVNTERLIQIFESSIIITNIISSRFVITSPICKKTCEGEQKVFALNARGGVINNLLIPIDLKDFELADSKNQNICFPSDETAEHKLLFLPPNQIHPRYAIQNYEFEFVKKSQVCPISLKIHVSPFSSVICHEITIRFSSIKHFSCPLQATQEMIKVLAQFYRVKPSQIIVIRYHVASRTTPSKEQIVLVFSFAEEIIECSHCSSTLLENFISQIIDAKGSVTREFQQLIATRFILSNVTYSISSQNDANLAGITVFSTSWTPLWIYMLPLFMVLFLLFLLLLTCCCCCGGFRRRKRRVASVFESLSTCCLCCYANKNGVTKVQRVYSNSTNPSVHRISINTANHRGDERAKHVLTSNQSINSSTNLKTTTAAINKNTSVNISNSTAPITASSGENTVVTYATVHKKKSDAVQKEEEESHYAPPNSILKEKEEKGTRTPGSVAFQLNRSTSKRVRSYSDGFLLDDDYLDLPEPPVGERSTEQPTRRYSRRVSRKYFRDDSQLNNGGKFERHKITIPIRITARVRNISKSLDDGLDDYRPMSVRYTETSDKDPFVSTYRSKETTFERATPLMLRRKFDSDPNSSFKSKIIEKHQTTAKRYPWESEIKSFRRKSTKKWDGLASKYSTWRNPRQAGVMTTQGGDFLKIPSNYRRYSEISESEF